MALFKFQWPGRKGDDGKAAKPAAAPRTENIDAMRQRARHRLIGAAVLVLLGVVGFPMLFDTQPRPISVDTPIEIPDRNKVAPLVVPAGQGSAAAPSNTAAATPPTTGARVADSLADGEEVVASAAVRPKPAAPVAPVKPEPRPEPKAVKPEPKPEPRIEPKVAPKTEPKSEPAKPVPHVDDSARARALLEGRAAPAAATAAQEGRFVVQIGAFADAGKANEVRQKLERAGLKSHTQVVSTKDGQRTRVRVGPFEGRSAADKAVVQIKALDLPASVLTL